MSGELKWQICRREKGRGCFGKRGNPAGKNPAACRRAFMSGELKWQICRREKGRGCFGKRGNPAGKIRQLVGGRLCQGQILGVCFYFKVLSCPA